MLVNNTGIMSVFVIASVIFFCVFECFLSYSSIFHTRNFDTVSYKTFQCLNWKSLVESVVSVGCFVLYKTESILLVFLKILSWILKLYTSLELLSRAIFHSPVFMQWKTSSSNHPCDDAGNEMC